MSPIDVFRPQDGKPLLTLANKITLARLFLIPAIVIGLLENQTWWLYILLLLTMLTDLLDGIVARVRGERTALGAFLDPMADKLLLLSIFMILTLRGPVPAWAFVVILSRDLLIVLGWFVIYILTGSSSIYPRWLGKATTAIQMSTAFLLVVGTPQPFRKIVLILTCAATLASAIDYIIVGERRLGGWG